MRMVSVAAEGLEEGAAVGAGKVVMEAEEMAVEAEEAIEAEVMSVSWGIKRGGGGEGGGLRKGRREQTAGEAVLVDDEEAGRTCEDKEGKGGEDQRDGGEEPTGRNED